MVPRFNVGIHPKIYFLLTPSTRKMDVNPRVNLIGLARNSDTTKVFRGRNKDIEVDELILKLAGDDGAFWNGMKNLSHCR